VLAFLAPNGLLGTPSSSVLWGNSIAAWLSRFLLGLTLVTLDSEHARSLRYARQVTAILILSLGFASAIAPQDVGSAFYIPNLSAVTLASFALAAVLLDTEYRLIQALIPWLAFVGIVLNALTLLGYLYEATPLYGGLSGTVGVCSAGTSLLLGVGFLAAAGPHRTPLRLLLGQSVSAQVLRSILPVTCGAMLLGEVLSDLVRGGPRQNFAVQDALQTFFATVFVTGVVTILARRVGKRLDHAEKERDTAQAALAHINESLAETVAARTAQLERANQELRGEITRRSEIERALRESEAKSNALLSAIPDWIFRLRSDGTVLDTRAPREPSLDHAEQSPALHTVLAAKVSDWVRQNPQFTNQETVDFSLLVENSTYEARYVRTSEGEILAVIRDISELSRLERELLEANVREQRRIGEELHDSLGQPLTAVGFLSKTLELELREQNLPQAEQAAEIGRQISAGIATLRSLARGLFRYELGPHSLVDALQDLAAAADLNFRVQCTLHADRSIILPDRSADLHVYRICQEAITNAVKHGNAKKIKIEFKRAGSKILFQIRDDGTGAPLEVLANGSNGIGLRTMEFRTRRLGGRFSIESRAGAGTSITCTLPDPAAAPQSECDNPTQLLITL
jgi:signal transduction histidine kinase